MIMTLQTWMDKQVIVDFWEMLPKEPAHFFYFSYYKCLFDILLENLNLSVVFFSIQLK